MNSHSLYLWGGAAQVSADPTPLILRGGRPKTRRRTINLVEPRRRARPRLSRGEVRRGCGKQARRAKHLRSGGADETLSLLTGCFQKPENIDLKYL